MAAEDRVAAGRASVCARGMGSPLHALTPTCALSPSANAWTVRGAVVDPEVVEAPAVAEDRAAHAPRTPNATTATSAPGPNDASSDSASREAGTPALPRSAAKRPTPAATTAMRVGACAPIRPHSARASRFAHPPTSVLLPSTVPAPVSLPASLDHLVRPTKIATAGNVPRTAREVASPLRTLLGLTVLLRRRNRIGASNATGDEPAMSF